MSAPTDGPVIGPMSSRTVIALVARREITTRSRSRAYRISTVIMLLVIIGFSAGAKVLGGSKTSKDDVGFVAATQSLAQPLAAAAKATGLDVATHVVDDQAQGDQLVKDKKLDAVVIGSPSKFQVDVNKSIDDPLRSTFTLLLRERVLDQQIVNAGGDPAQVESALADAKVSIRELKPQSSTTTQRAVVGIFAGILVYLALMLYGQTVAQGVVEEKSNRIVELLLSAIRPWHLMTGKVLGIGAVGMAQIVVVAGTGLATAAGLGVLTIPISAITATALWSLGFFVLGFFTFALMFAAVGALVSRQEDVGGASAPVILLLVIPYVLGISILPTNPSNPLLKTLSMVPLFSQTLMPMRLGSGVPAWQSGLALGLCAVMFVVMAWLSSRIYNHAVMRTGAKIKLREALHAV